MYLGTTAFEMRAFLFSSYLPLPEWYKRWYRPIMTMQGHLLQLALYGHARERETNCLPFYEAYPIDSITRESH